MSRTSIVLNPQIPNVHADAGRFEYQRGEAIKALLCGGTAVQETQRKICECDGQWKELHVMVHAWSALTSDKRPSSSIT